MTRGWRPTAARLLRVVALAFLVTWLLLALAVALGQRRLLYHPPRPTPVTAHAGIQALRLPFDVGDERGEVQALWLPAAPTAATAVFFHGNAEQAADLSHLARRFAARGVGFLAPEYPGYGMSAGPGASEASLIAAAEAAVRWLRARPNVRGPVVLIGRSLGSGVAVQLAAKGLGDALILITPYTSIAERAGQLFPWLPARWLVRDRFDSLARAPEVSVPTLIVHGSADDVIPLAMGEAMAAAIAGARLYKVPDASHDGVLRDDAAAEAVLAFAAAAGR